MFTEALSEFVGFVALFLAFGAIGFRLFVWRGNEHIERAPRRAAVLGLIGTVVTLAMTFAFNLPEAAGRKHTSIGHYLATNPSTAVQVGAEVLAAIAFLVAIGRIRAAWPFATIGVVGYAVTPLFFGQWTRAINPVHRFAGGLWIGTLFVLVVAGIDAVLQRPDLDAVQRGKVAASMVNRFSPLALVSFAVLGGTGLWTAWRHLKRLDALWTTSYGYALIAKLCVVLIVVALGAFNWRKQRPLLGTESAATALRRSAVAELAFATVVLMITAVLVSLPSPD